MKNIKLYTVLWAVITITSAPVMTMDIQSSTAPMSIDEKAPRGVKRPAPTSDSEENSRTLMPIAHAQEDASIQCPTCKKIFNQQGDLEVHIKRKHTHEDPFVCSECQRAFSKKAHLKRHVFIHTGEAPFSCSHCKAKFTLQRLVTLHEKSCKKRPTKTSQKTPLSHTSHSSFLPDLNSPAMPQQDAAPEQQPSISDDPNFLPLPALIKQESALPEPLSLSDSHDFSSSSLPIAYAQEDPSILGVPGEIPSLVASVLLLPANESSSFLPDLNPPAASSYVETMTDRPVNTSTSSSDEEENPVHKKSTQAFACSEQRIHTGDKPYSCKECGQRFKQKSNLTSHMKIHKCFECKVCKKIFSKKHILAAHVQAHNLKKHLENLKHKVTETSTDDPSSLSLSLPSIKQEQIFMSLAMPDPEFCISAPLELPIPEELS